MNQEHLDIILTLVKDGHLEYQKAAQLLSQLESSGRAENKPLTEIAVIGMACRFPGADSPEAFWELLARGESTVAGLPLQRWGLSQLDSYAQWGGFLEAIDQFDAPFFGISESEAIEIDPQQRIFLEIAFEAFQRAGYSRQRLSGSKSGVFVGNRSGQYSDTNDQAVNRSAVIANMANFIPARVSEFFNLKGPSLSVDTACSSSLVALHLACESLGRGESDLALAGGIELKVTPLGYRNLTAIKALSNDGTCHTFDKKANGFVPGEGAGAVLLKPLVQAQQDGDPVLAVIKSSAVNNDGHTMGITSPDLEAQVQVIRSALEQAGLEPDALSYIEAHGTGTAIGDPIEIKGLQRVFQKSLLKSSCALGSVKTNFGHLDTAAGIASLVKVLLLLQHRKLVPTLHCEEPNPRFAIENSPFYINDRLADWESNDQPRRAGISAFGFGGTNCHVIVQEFAPPAILPEPVQGGTFCLSAASSRALQELAVLYQQFLTRTDHINLSDLCYSQACCRDHYAHRLAVTVDNIAGLVRQLEQFARTGQVAVDQGTAAVLKSKRKGKNLLLLGHRLEMSEQDFKAIEQDFPVLAELIIQNQSLLPGQSENLPAFVLWFALLTWLDQAGLDVAYSSGTGIGWLTAAVMSLGLDQAETLSLLSQLFSHSPRAREKMSLLQGKKLRRPLFMPNTWQLLTDCDESLIDYLLSGAIEQAPLTVPLALKGVAHLVTIGETDTANSYPRACLAEQSRLTASGIHRWLGELFVQGISYQADQGIFRGRFMPVPLYPLQRRSYWKLPLAGANTQTEKIKPLSLPGRPVYDDYEEKSNGQRVYHKVYQYQDRILQDHIVHHMPLVAGMVWVNTLYHIGRELVGGDCSLYDVLFLSPLYIENETVKRKVSISVTHKEGDFEVTIASTDQPQGGQKTDHARAIIKKSVNLPENNPQLDDQHWQKKLPRHVTADQLYANFIRYVGIRHGDFFRGVTDVYSDGRQFLIHLALPEAVQAEAGSFLIHPGLLDSALQGMQAVVFTNQQTVQNYEAFVPFYLGAVQIFKPLNQPAYALARILKQNQEVVRFQVSLYDRQGGLLLHINDGSSKHIRQQDLRDYFYAKKTGSGVQKGQWSHTLHWQAEQTLPSPQPVLSRPGVSLLFIGAGESQARLKSELTGQGHQVISIAARSTAVKADYTIDPREADAFENMISSIQQEQTIAEIIYGWSWQTADPDSRIESMIEQIIYPLCRLAAALTRKGLSIPVSILTSQAQPGFAADRHSTAVPVFAALWGMVRVMARENPRLTWYTFDLPVAESYAAIAVQKLAVKSREAELVYCNQKWYVPRLKPAAAGTVNPGLAGLKQEAVYLITGGRQGLGLVLAHYLVQTYQARLVLLSRRADRENESDPANEEEARLLQALGNQPERVLFLSADVTDRQSLARALTRARQHFGCLQGVFHCAGVNDDALFVNKSLASFQKVAAPKMSGTIYLDELTQSDKLDFFVLFSSRASVEGVISQCDYAAANAFLDSYAVYRQKQGSGLTRVINWGLWDNIGMGKNAATRAHARQLKVAMITPLEGMKQLEQALQSESIQTIIDPNPIQLRTNNLPGPTTAPNQEAGMPSISLAEAARTYISRLITGFSQIPLSDLETEESSFLELGLDSDQLMLLIRKLEQAFSIKLYPTLFFEYQTITALTGYLVETFSNALAPIVLPAIAAASSAESGPDQVPGPVPIGRQEQNSSSLQEQIMDYLCRLMSQYTHGQAEEIDTEEKSFLELGVDSAQLIELIRQLEQIFSIKLYPTLFFEYQTISALSGFFMENFPGPVSQVLQQQSNLTAVSRQEEVTADPFPSALLPQSSAQKPLPRAETTAPVITKKMAILSYGLRFPGAANGRQFWQNIIHKKDCITAIPGQRWDHQAFYREQVQAGHYYCPKGGFIENIAAFDPLFFNISPREALVMDPKQRLFLEAAWETLEKAGYLDYQQQPGIGVFVGTSYNYYFYNLRHEERQSPFAPLGNGLPLMSNRLSFLLDLTGPSLQIDTYCSSALVALNAASQSILNGECRLALVGGAHAPLAPDHYVTMSQMEALSYCGYSQSFSRNADGYVPGEGVAAILIKELDQALADGDLIQAVITASAVNHGGHANNITSPSARAQTQVVQEALKQAAIDPATIELIEAHGTGTKLGDPIELQSLTAAFRDHTERKSYCALGSVKSNIGHLEPASGLAGLIKVLLALQQKVLPPTLHINEPSPFIELNQTPFYLNDQPRAWPEQGSVRRAAINAFGLSGTNAHVIVEEAPARIRSPLPLAHESYLLPLSAKTPAALLVQAEQYYTALQEQPQWNGVELAFTAACFRKHFAYRLILEFAHRDELLEKLGQLVKEKSNHALYQLAQHQGEQAKKSAAFFCPPVCCKAADLQAIVALSGQCYQELERIKQIAHDNQLAIDQLFHPSQLLTFVQAYLLCILLQEWGITPHCLAGEGMGRQAAAVIAGQIKLEHAVKAIISGKNPVISGQPGISLTDAAELMKGKYTVIALCPAHSYQEQPFVFSLPDQGKLRQNLLHLVAGLYGQGISIAWSQIYPYPRQAMVELPTYPFQRKSFWSQSYSLPQPGAGAAPGPAIGRHEGEKSLSSPETMLHYVRQQWIEKELSRGSKRLSSQVVLLLVDGEELRTSLESALLPLAHEILVVSRGDYFMCHSRGYFSLNPGQASDYTELFQCLTEMNLTITTVIQAWGLGEAEGKTDEEVTLDSLFAGPLFSLLQIINGLNTIQDQSRLNQVYALTDHVYPENIQVRATGQAALSGLIKSLVKESSLQACILHFDHREANAAVMSRALLAEFENPGQDIEILYQGGKRYSSILAPVQLPDRSSLLSMAKPGVFIVVGGAHGIGALAARYLAETRGSHIAVIGKSALPARSDWESAPLTEAQARRIKALTEIEAAGSRVSYHQADINDLKEIKQTIAQIRLLGPITGVIHSAGLLNDCLMAYKSLSRFQTIIAPKTGGIYNLDQALQSDQWQFFIAFSSLSGLIGNAGQTDYSAANAFLDHYLSLRRSQTGRRYLSINWPLWQSGGMQVKPAVLKQMEKHGLYPLATEEGLGALAAILQLSSENIGVIKGKTTLFETGLAHKAGTNAEQTTAHERQKSDPPLKIEQMIRQILQKELGLSGREIRGNKSFDEWGVDSLVMKRLLTALEEQLALSIDPAAVFEYPTITTFAQYLAETGGLPPDDEARADQLPLSQAETGPANKAAGEQLPDNQSSIKKSFINNSSITQQTVEQFLVKHLKESLLLEERQIARHRHFEELGLDSVSMKQMVRQLETVTGAAIDPAVIFEHSTIQRLAQYLAEQDLPGIKTMPARPGTVRIGQTAANAEQPSLEQDLDWAEIVKSAIKEVCLLREEEYEPTITFMEYAVDQDRAKEIVKRLEKKLGHAIEAPSVLEHYPTGSALALYLSSVSIKTASNHIPGLEPARQPLEQPIAIIGYSCRFPGAANREEFWQNLQTGQSSIRPVPGDRWSINDYYDPDPAAIDKTYCRVGGFVDHFDHFDADFFDLPPEEAKLLDPQQRLALMVAHETLEHAGYSKRQLWDSNCGVFFGARWDRYTAKNSSPETVRGYLTGYLTNFIANRISDFYNLRGPSLVYDTACSSSLVSVHYACQALLDGECELALAGGTEIKIDPEPLIALSTAQALSRDGVCRVFDRHADGFVPGEGIGAILLKPLDQALADHDSIYGVIRGSAVNNDGNTMGITTPDPDAQYQVINRALQRANVSPATISYVEAHGTGTMIGDPIEIKALTNAFRDYTQNQAYCAIGSVKTNIGHLDTAAGIAGIIKIILALEHKTIPPTLNCHEPNPRFRFVDSPFYPSLYAQPWPAVHGPRRAAISAFGFGGTNCHMIIEEAPERLEKSLKEVPQAKTAFKHSFLTLSAKNAASLARLTKAYAGQAASLPEHLLPHFCYTANTGRDHYALRRAFFFDNGKQLSRQLASQSGPQTESLTRKRDVIFFFPSRLDSIQNLARLLYGHSARFARTIDLCLEQTKAVLDRDLKELLFNQSALSQNNYQTGPIILFIFSCALARFWQSLDLQPAGVMGIGFGEYAAAVSAGILSLPDAIKIVSQLAAKVPQIDNPGGQILCPALIKDPDLVQQVQTLLHDLPVKAAQIPLINPASGNLVDLVQPEEHYWINQLKKPVTIDTVHSGVAQFSAPLILGIGSQALTTGPMGTPSNNNDIVLVAPEIDSGLSLDCLLQAAVDLYLAGVNLDFSNFYPPQSGWQRIALPTYAFETTSYWVNQSRADSPQWENRFSGPSDQEPVFKTMAYAGHNQYCFTSLLEYKKQPIVQDHLIQGQPTLPGTAQWYYLYQAARILYPLDSITLTEIVHQTPVIVPRAGSVEIKITLIKAEKTSRLTLASRQPGSETWTLHSKARLALNRENSLPAYSISTLFSQGEKMTAAAVYQAYQETGIVYQEAMQSIHQLAVSEGQVCCQLRLPLVLAEKNAALAVFSSLMDGLLQSTIAFSSLEARSDTRIPFFIESIDYTGFIPAECYGVVRITPAGHADLTRCNLSLLDQSGRVICAIQGFHFKKMPVPARAAARIQTDNRILIPHWLRKELSPDRPGQNNREQWDCLILVLKKEKKQEQIASVLAQQVENLIRVYLDESGTATENTYFIRDRQPAAWPALFEQLTGQGIKKPAVLFCAAFREKAALSLDPAGQQQLLDQGLYHASALASCLAALPGPSRLVILSTFAHILQYNEQLQLCPESCMLSAIALAARAEECGLSAVHLDIDYAGYETEAIVSLCLKEMADGREPIAAYRRRKRWIPGQRSLPDRQGPFGEIRLIAGATYLITGGSGGIGLELAQYLAEQVKPHLILLQRTRLPSAGQWDKVLQQPADYPEKVVRIVEKLKILQQKGARITCYQVDIADIEQMQKLGDWLCKQFTAIHGVIHSAGLIQDSRLAQLKLEQWEKVLAPKVRGTLLLDQMLTAFKPDFTLYCSGAVTQFGSQGQANYIAANLYLDAYAYLRQARGMRTMVINWWAWKETGLAARPYYQKFFEQMGIQPLSNQEALDLFAKALKTGVIQVITTDGLSHKRQSTAVEEQKILVPAPAGQSKSNVKGAER